MIAYINAAALKNIFPYIAERYGRIEEVPDYQHDQQGIPQLLGVLDRVQMDTYYPSLFDKAAYLFIAINKGHFFGNGNKRLSLVITTIFLLINNKDLAHKSKDFYRQLLDQLFPEQKNWTDFPDFSDTDFATYNISIVIADSGALGIDHDALKDRVLNFLKGSTVDINVKDFTKS